MEKEFITLKLKDIHPYPNNPRINDAAVEDVAESIRQSGNLDPIEIDEDNVILSGHTRLKALKKLGYTETESSCRKPLCNPHIPGRTQNVYRAFKLCRCTV